MGLSEGPLKAGKFAGASIASFSSAGGWDDQRGTCTIRLVEDRGAGDSFAWPVAGTPATVSFGGFTFGGIVQHVQKTGDKGGDPLYEVTLVDPREALEACQVVLAGLSQPTSGVPNLLNVFGYWEAKLGFGGSLSNEAGMLWDAPFEVINLEEGTTGGVTITRAGRVGIAPALADMMATAGPYGGPIRLRGHSYRVDLTGLPPAPSYYRLGGVSRNLLELISELCQDAGYSMMVVLDGDVIRFKTASRRTQPAGGQVANFVQGASDVVGRRYGVEFANNPTNAVVMGGHVRELLMVRDNNDRAIWPFWGEDPNGNAIVGEGPPEGDHRATVNAVEVADVLGSTSYELSVLELRCAAADFESWAFFLMKYRPAVADAIGLANSIDAESDLAELFPDILLRRDMLAIRPQDAAAFGAMNEDDFWTNRVRRVYEFVAKFAKDFYGRKFLVRLPVPVYWKIEPETNLRVASDQISDGGYLPENSTPLGLPYTDIDKFMTNEGLFTCFVAFEVDPKMNLSDIPYESAAYAGGTVYLRAQAEQKLYYAAGQPLPYCVVTLDQPIYRVLPDPLGGVEEVAKLCGLTPSHVAFAAGSRHGSWPVRIDSPAYRPKAAAVPLLRTRMSYGPWGIGQGGGEGRTHFEVDESLTPWNYGDYETLRQAAEAKIVNMVSAMQESETASFTKAGTPDHSIGDALVEGGPLVTGVTLEFGAEGVTTTTEIRTFTPAFGTFARYNAERLRRLGQSSAQIRREVRALFRRQSDLRNPAVRQFSGFLENLARPVLQRTPHEAIMASVAYSAQHGFRTQASLMTVEEMFANVRADNPEIYGNTAGATLESIFRPFSTDTEGAGDLPHYKVPHDFITSEATTVEELDPLSDSDIDILVTGDTYPGTLHRLKGDGLLYEKARGVGHATPMVLVGWGRELTGKPFPNGGDEELPIHEWSDNWDEDHKKQIDRFRAGPLFTVFDEFRGVWTVPTILRGTLDEEMHEEDGAMMSIKVYGNEVGKVRVYYDEEMGGLSVLRAGKKIIASYDQLEGRWVVTGAACI